MRIERTGQHENAIDRRQKHLVRDQQASAGTNQIYYLTDCRTQRRGSNTFKSRKSCRGGGIWRISDCFTMRHRGKSCFRM